MNAFIESIKTVLLHINLFDIETAADNNNNNKVALILPNSTYPRLLKFNLRFSMVMLSSLKLLSCKSFNVENETPRDTLSRGVKCPRKRFTTCPKEVIFSQETLIRCGEPSLHVQGAIVFHMGQSGIPTESPRMESNNADMMAMVFISFLFPPFFPFLLITHICCTLCW